MAAASLALSPEVKDVLTRSTVAGNRLDLPPGQLDRKLYEAVAKALLLLGGVWNKKARAHFFEEPAEEVVADAIATGAVVDFRKEFQFFETPAVIAERLVALADIRPGQMVLEPSPGRGRIIVAIRAAGAEPLACELREDNREHLRALGVGLVGEDFLRYQGKTFDRIVANPPFSRQQDITHVLHMVELLKPGGRVVSIMSPGWAYRQDRRSMAFRELVNRAGAWEALPEGSFKASGTSVNAGIVTLLA